MAELKPGWQRVKFGEVVRLNKETCKDPAAAGVERVIGLEHLEPGDLRVRSWADVADGTTFTNRVRPGQVLFGKRRAYQRKVAVADFDAVCSGDIYTIESIDPVRLLPGLLPFICLSDSFFEHAIGTSAGSLSPRTNWKSLADYELELPPISEQEIIERLLQSIHNVIEHLHLAELALAKLEEIQFQHLLLGKNRHQGDLAQTPFGLAPTDWPLRAICEIGDVAYGISAAVSDNSDPSIGWPILTGANLTLGGGIDLGKIVYHPKPSNSSFILQKGDILLNWRSGSAEHVGKSAIFDLEGEWTFASFILRLRLNETANIAYLWRLLNFMRAKRIFHKGTSQQINFKMNAAHFRQIEVIFPPRPEQDRIISSMRRTWAAQQGLNQRSQAARKALCTALAIIRGGKDVR